jgi:type I restriction enzyme S subunit
LAEQSRTYGKGASQGNLNLGLIRTFKVPLPPLNEQLRIVAKVDELMSLCDQLETRLLDTQAERHRLLEAVLHHALAISGDSPKMSEPGVFPSEQHPAILKHALST